jgi:hypothetical protein
MKVGQQITINDVLIAALKYVNTRIADNEKTGKWEIIDDDYDHTVVLSALNVAHSAERVIHKAEGKGF